MLSQLARRDLASIINTPLQIGNKNIKTRLNLAPMAGLGHVAMREAISQYGGYGLLFTGMLNAKAVPTENPRTSHLFRFSQSELPALVGQIFGKDPAWMAAAAKRLEQEGFWGVDINMGCSVSTIVRQGAGAALLREHAAAVSIVEAVREVTNFPLLVKMRTGWSRSPEPAIELAQALQAAGADAITFHPRISPDRRTRPPILEHLRLIKQALQIPVFGNGDICSPGDCVQVLQKTGCDGLAIGRAAICRPWLFQSISSGQDEMENIENKIKSSAELIFKSIFMHFGPTLGIKAAKKYAQYLAANFATGSRLVGTFKKAENLNDLLETLNLYLDKNPQINRRPNMLLFNM